MRVEKWNLGRVPSRSSACYLKDGQKTQKASAEENACVVNKKIKDNVEVGDLYFTAVQNICLNKFRIKHV